VNISDGTNLLFQAKEDRDNLEGAFCALSIYTRMLTYILSSASLVTHLNVFLKVEMLATMVPKSANKRAYQAFAKKEVIGFEGKAVPNEQNDLTPPESVDYPEVGSSTFYNTIMLNICLTV
jgi:hypothetical protein